jgi:hypothetical protein
MEQASKHERAKRLIRDLLNKTVENGATEAEALAAFEKANELMLQYDISIEDAQQVRDDTYGALKRQYGKGSARRRTWHEAIDLAMPIATFTGTEVWRSPREGTVHYFGRKQDVELAHYLLDLCINTCESEWQAFRQLHTLRNEYGISQGGDTSIRGRKSFLRGMIHRMSDRLYKLAAERQAAMAQTEKSRALVVVKQQVVAEKFRAYKAQSGLRLVSSGTQRRTYSHGANYAAGQAAGDRVNFGTGVGQAGSAGRLGRD